MSFMKKKDINATTLSEIITDVIYAGVINSMCQWSNIHDIYYEYQIDILQVGRQMIGFFGRFNFISSNITWTDR